MDPLYNRERVNIEASFGTKIDDEKTMVLSKNAKVMSTTFVKMSCDLILKLWNFLYIFGMAEATNFKFGTQTDHEEFKRKICKIRLKWVAKGSRNLLLELWAVSYTHLTLPTNREV